MTRAHVSAGGSIIRYVVDGAPPTGWTDLPCHDVGDGLQPGPDQVLDGPFVTIADDAVTREWTLRPKTDAERWVDVRAERDLRLKKSDTQSRAAWADVWEAQTPEWRVAWGRYREELRTLPATYADAGPGAVIWPDPPAL